APRRRAAPPRAGEDHGFSGCFFYWSPGPAVIDLLIRFDEIDCAPSTVSTASCAGMPSAGEGAEKCPFAVRADGFAYLVRYGISESGRGATVEGYFSSTLLVERGWLLLRQTVQRAQPPDEVDRVHAHDRAIGKELGQDPEGLAIGGIVEGGDDHRGVRH